ncbi:hypothetical protein MSG28_012029 [Choristoneura fumiferana]|uniref:Uncharacterized protein n=1 Tax=Choristoneura fumiferana TaxID=7141 RepID=A0ACC0KMV4_CHOFU|nr:hypothetical protein MSG28_012029 [Choristoneura fumiferana]
MDLTTVVPDTMLNATTHAPEMIQSFINVTVKNCPGSQGGQMFLTILKVGMMASMVAASYAPWVRETRAYCIIRVVLRVFGIGSVCIAGSGCCTRYRLAVTTLDKVYAWFYVMFGTLLCVILVYCNMAVIRALYEISAPRGAPVVRRVSKSSCRQRAAAGAPHRNPATAEEVAFSRLMAALSITSSLYLSLGAGWWRRLGALGAASDLLMLLNYVLDPLLYNHKTSTESIKTSCCPQETILVSDSSGAEMRPLRALPTPPQLLD